MLMAQVVRKFRFSGQVQGVGFRFTTRRHAEAVGVCGYVRNLSDGDVELVAAGKEVDIAALLKKIDASFGTNVTGVVEEPPPTEVDYAGFQILF